MGVKVLLLCTAAAFAISGPACSPAPDGDADADSDSDGDVDGDADADGEACDPSAECCDDSDCSNGVYCDGLEVCDRGRCDPGFPIDCDDELACTEDICDEMANLCVHVPQHEECDDGDLCNGEERCDPAEAEADERGCSPGSPMICDDMDPCTEDYCEDDECLVALKDSDDDGYGDDECELCDDPEDPSTCERGDDCNDSNPLTYPGAVEICDDGDDNNCDRVRDYADPSCDVPNDSCATALLLPRDTVVHSSLRGTAGDIDSGCSPASHRDVAFSFNITSVQDVDIRIVGRGGRDLTVALTPECGNAAADIKCTTGRDFTQIHRSLSPGTYYVIVSADGEADFDITLSHDDPAPRPAGDQCATAPDVSAGGSFSGTTVDFDPDYDATCGDVTDRDATFELTVTETTALDLTVNAGGERIAVTVQSTCGVPSTESACFEGSPVSGRVGHLAPGTYYIVVKSAGEVDFDMTLDFLPTAADSCADVLDASTPGTYWGTTVGLTADIATSCGPSAGPDGAYSFTLPREQDVTVDFVSSGEATTLSLQSACGDPASELRCSTGTDFQLRGRGLPAGTYYLVATGDRGADFELDISMTDPVPRPADDLCTGAIPIPAGGGTFSGDTFDCENDYESRCGSSLDLDTAFTFTLTEARSMDLSVTAGTGPVTVAIQGSCGVVGTERGCFSVSTVSDRHFRSLDAGTWYLVFKTATPDDFDFTISFGTAEPGVPINFFGLPWDMYEWDADVSTVFYRAVTYGYGADPIIGAVSENVDTTGSTSSSSPGGSYAGEYNSTIAALVYAGIPRSNIIEITSAADATARLGTYDVLLFMEQERGMPATAPWVAPVRAHLDAGGRVVATYCVGFISGLGIFGTGSTIYGSPPYSIDSSHPFWDPPVTHPTRSMNATTYWSWTSPDCDQLAWITSTPAATSVLACDIP